MSAAHDAHADHDAGHHDASHHDHFDNEPIQELPADEPRTPSWIPILGLALFFVAGTAWLLMGPSDDKDKPNAEGAPVAAAAAPQPPPAPQPAAQPQARPTPAAIGSGSLRQLSPEQAAQIQKQIEAMRALREKQGQGAPSPAPPAEKQ